MNTSEKKIKVLFLAANPIDHRKLNYGEEISEIEKEIESAKFRDKFELEMKFAVKAEELSKFILKDNPDILHFSGHGSEESAIILQNRNLKGHVVTPKALTKLFSLFKDKIKLVVLNACYTEKQAIAISEHIPCVVGMSRAITDTAARHFVKAFYRGLANGRNIEDAVKFGRVQVMAMINSQDEIPKLLTKTNYSGKITFVE